ncbi:hypothetical protein [Desulfocurvus sp. DL9XJH121]
MEAQWFFTEGLFGFCGLVLAMRTGRFVVSRGHDVVRRIARIGNGDFYCFFPTRSFAGKRAA